MHVERAVSALDVVVESVTFNARALCELVVELFNGNSALWSVHFDVANVVVECGVHVALITNRVTVSPVYAAGFLTFDVDDLDDAERERTLQTAASGVGVGAVPEKTQQAEAHEINSRHTSIPKISGTCEQRIYRKKKFRYIIHSQESHPSPGGMCGEQHGAHSFVDLARHYCN